MTPTETTLIVVATAFTAVGIAAVVATAVEVRHHLRQKRINKAINGK